MDATATTAPAQSIVHWATIHPVQNQDHVEAIAASMDSNPDHWVWDGPPLVADIDAGQLYSGVHRQAALRLLHERDGIEGWDIPVVDIWDLIDNDTFDARTNGGEDPLAVVQDLMAGLPQDQLDGIGWDIH